MPKDKRTNEELAAQFAKMAEQLELMDDPLSENPQWQDRLHEIIAFLPKHVTSDLVDRMRLATHNSSENIAAFSRLYGLTKAEQKLLISLAAGHTVPDHAKKMDISVNTGRVHMQRILDKTAAKGQLDLMKMLHKH